MTPERYKELETTDHPLTKEEVAEGWHFCPDWDEMLIHQSWPEKECCLCDPPHTP